MSGPITRRTAMVTGAAALVAACSSKFQTYSGPEVTQVLVLKSRRQMVLLHRDQVLRGYDVALGFAPRGHKFMRGDGRTPEGRYWIDRRNPRSDFHLSVGISYPDAEDRAFAAKHGVDPGGDIFIHGQPNGTRRRRRRGDWTAGCIAVTNPEIEEIYAMVGNGTPIRILA